MDIKRNLKNLFDEEKENISSKKSIKDLLEKVDLKDVFILSEILNNPNFEK